MTCFFFVSFVRVTISPVPGFSTSTCLQGLGFITITQTKEIFKSYYAIFCALLIDTRNCTFKRIMSMFNDFCLQSFSAITFSSILMPVQLLTLGVNLKGFPSSSLPALSSILFHAGIAATLLLYGLFWLKVLYGFFLTALL